MIPGMIVPSVASRTVASRGMPTDFANPALTMRPSSITTFELGAGSRSVPSINVPLAMTVIIFRLLAPKHSSRIVSLSSIVWRKSFFAPILGRSCLSRPTDQLPWLAHNRRRRTRRTTLRMLSDSSSLPLPAPSPSDFRRRYLAVKTLQRLEEIVVTPDEFALGSQINVLVVAPLGKDTRHARIVGPSGGQIAFDQRPHRLPGAIVVARLQVSIRNKLAQLEQRRSRDGRRRGVALGLGDAGIREVPERNP